MLATNLIFLFLCLFPSCFQNERLVLLTGGMVIFFPSYDYLADVYEVWDRRGVLRELSLAKRVFREPRQAGSAEQVLAAFSAAVASGRGGLLLCVVGGKMSEGINFSDDLGRAVVIIGLPYANPKDPQLVEKMTFLDAKFGGEFRITTLEKQRMACHLRPLTTMGQ